MLQNFANFVLFALWRLLRWSMWLLWAVFRPAIRFISALLMLAAVFALTADVTRWQVGEGDPMFHSLAYHIAAFAPTTFEGVGKSISEGLHPAFWDYGLLLLLSVPAWAIFSVLSLAIALTGREPKRINVFIN